MTIDQLRAEVGRLSPADSPSAELLLIHAMRHIERLTGIDSAAAALDDECASIGFTSETFKTPREALGQAIGWHVATSLDPAVSSAAQALIEQGRAQAIEAIKAMSQPKPAEPWPF